MSVTELNVAFVALTLLVLGLAAVALYARGQHKKESAQNHTSELTQLHLGSLQQPKSKEIEQ